DVYKRQGQAHHASAPFLLHARTAREIAEPEKSHTSVSYASITEAKRLTEHMLKALIGNQQYAELVPRLMLWGPPGIGKSQAVADLCKEHSASFYDIRPGETSDAAETAGTMVPYKVSAPDPTGKLTEVLRVKRAISRQYPPSDHPHPGIILFDELSAAEPTIQVACYRIILDRNLGDWKVPSRTYVMAAGNRTDDQAIAYTMPSALANRFCHLEITSDAQAFVTYLADRNAYFQATKPGTHNADKSHAKDKEQDQDLKREHLIKESQKYRLSPLPTLHGETEEPRSDQALSSGAGASETKKPFGWSPYTLAYISCNPNMVYGLERAASTERGWSSPRSLEQVSFITRLYTEKNVFSEREMFLLTQGLIGTDDAQKYMNFVNLCQQQMPSIPHLIAEDGGRKKLPSDKDVQVAVGYSLAYAVLKRTPEELKKNPKFLSGVAEAYQAMSSDAAKPGLQFLSQSLAHFPELKSIVAERIPLHSA
ncbi:MAG: hypothetical protein N3A02_05600, partial [Rectinema sp.]|nr:hypothetical protein [Rectinema sp.]